MLRPSCLMIGSLALLVLGATDFRPAVADQTVVVVLDDSGSMDRTMASKGQRRMAAAKLALATVLRNLSHDTKIGILTLNSTVNGSNWIVPVGSPDPSRWSDALAQVHAKGGTPLGEFMRQGADELLQLRAKQPYETFRLLVVTDGEASDAPLLASLMPDLLSRGVNVDVIGVDMQEDHSLARSSHTYRKAGDQAALARALSEVFAETAVDDRSNQADFDMLSGLSDDVAAEIVKGLAAPRNEPLQLVSAATMQGNPSSFPAGSNSSSVKYQSSGVGAAFGTVCCFGGIGLAMLIAVAIVLKAVKNNTRS